MKYLPQINTDVLPETQEIKNKSVAKYNFLKMDKLLFWVKYFKCYLYKRVFLAVVATLSKVRKQTQY